MSGAETSPVSDGRVSFGNLAIDYGARSASLGGQALQLTRSEFDLLACLTRRPGTVVSSADLLSYIWDEPWQGDETSIETHVSRLRRKLGESATSPRFIWTIRGVGYRFEPEAGLSAIGIEPDDDGVRASRRWPKRRLVIALAALLGAALFSLMGFTAYRYLSPASTPGSCAAGYQPCLPVVADLDCPQVRQQVTVTGEDQYGLDRDGDGLGCQLYGPPP